MECNHFRSNGAIASVSAHTDMPILSGFRPSLWAGRLPASTDHIQNGNQPTWQPGSMRSMETSPPNKNKWQNKNGDHPEVATKVSNKPIGLFKVQFSAILLFISRYSNILGTGRVLKQVLRHWPVPILYMVFGLAVPGNGDEKVH